MNFGSLKIFQTSEEAVGFFKGLHGGSLSASLSAAVEHSGDSLLAAIKTGDEKEVEKWIVSTSKKLDSSDDLSLLTARKAALLEATRTNALNNDFYRAFYKGDAIDLAKMAESHRVKDEKFVSGLNRFLKVRDANVKELAEEMAHQNGGKPEQYLDKAKERWALSSQKTAEANGFGARKPETSTASQAQRDLQERQRLAQQAKQDSVTPGSEAQKPTQRQQQQQQQSNASGGNGGASGGADLPKRSFSGVELPSPRKITTPTKSGTVSAVSDEMPAAKLSADYLNDGHRGEQAWAVKQVSLAVGDGIPYGDFDRLAELEKMKAGYKDLVTPENKPHLLQTLVKYSWDNAGAYYRYAKNKYLGSTSQDTFLRHESMPNVFADTHYARPIIKSVDARMKATGFSEAIYEMQVKMRDLTERMLANPEMTALQYKQEMEKIYTAHTSGITFKQSAQKFVEALDKVIDELNGKIGITKGKEVLRADGKPLDVKKFGTFASEAEAGGLTGLTEDQAQNMIRYYNDIKTTALKVADHRSGFISEYMKAVPENFEVSSRESLAANMRTTFIGYHLQDGVVGGSRLGRIGSEVEQRATGYNLFKYSDDSIKKLNEWNKLSIEERLKIAQGKMKDDEWSKLSQENKNAALEAAAPKLKADLARYDEMTRLERCFRNSMASIYDRKEVLESKGSTKNPQAIFFTLLDEHNGIKGEWSVPGGNTFRTRLMNVEKQGYEEQIAEMVDMLINEIGTETGKVQTMPIGQIDDYLNTTIKEAVAAGDKYKTEIFTKIKGDLANLKQSPMRDGPRDVAANSWMPYYSKYVVARAFAGNAAQELPIPLKKFAISAAGLIDHDAGYKIEKALKINMPASAPQKYLTAQWATNNLMSRPLAYLLGIDTKVPTIKVRGESEIGHYPHDEINWLRLVTTGNKEYTPREIKDPWSIKGVIAKTANAFDYVATKHENAPGIVKIFTRPFQGGLDLIGSEGVKKAGALAYVSRAAYASVLAGGLLYTGAHALKGDDSWGEAGRDSINAALSIPRFTATYGGAIGAPHTLSAVEKVAEETIFVVSGAVSNITGNHNKYTFSNANLGIGNYISEHFSDKIMGIADHIKIPDLGKSEAESTPPPAPEESRQLSSNYNTQSSLPSWGTLQFNRSSSNLSTPAPTAPAETSPPPPAPETALPSASTIKPW